ncbi:MAG: hypothetical protein ACRDD8_05670 [Bacteroidales bacterium]
MLQKLTNKDRLIRLFEDAYDDEANYIIIRIGTKGQEELETIIIHKDNFETKLEYYKKAYDENLVLNSYDGIRIVGCGYTKKELNLCESLYKVF